MTSLAVRPAVAAAAVAAIAAVAPATASAATLTVGTSCARYVPGLAGEQWIPVTGTGFTPNTDPAFNSVELTYTSGDLGGYAPLAADGSLATNVFMPTEFISSSSGRTKTYTLTANDRATPGLTASAQVTLVRAGVTTKPARVRRNVRRKVRWSVFGAPTGARMYAHWTFKGRKRATRRMGRARGACGIARKRMPFVAARPRSGIWRVYFTRGKRYSRKRALFRVDLNVYRTFSSSARSATVAATRQVDGVWTSGSSALWRFSNTSAR
jgi:hypothetical protein